MEVGLTNLRPDSDDNADVYGRKIAQSEILSGKVQPTAAARPLLSTLSKYWFELVELPMVE